MCIITTTTTTTPTFESERCIRSKDLPEKSSSSLRATTRPSEHSSSLSEMASQPVFEELEKTKLDSLIEKMENLIEVIKVKNEAEDKQGKKLENLNIKFSNMSRVLDEITTRANCDDEDTILVGPTVSDIWARTGFEAREGHVEERAFIEKVKAARHLYIIVQSEAPPHYTLVEVHKSEDEFEPHVIEFRESLPHPPETPPRQVEKILRAMGLVGEDWRCPPRCNENTQKDDWSCGLWATRYIERSLRERRGEGRLPPVSIGDCAKRVNEFINKIQVAGKDDLEQQAKKQAKARAKTQAKAKAQAEKDEVARKQV